MTPKVTKNDRDLLTSIAEHKVLTVSQLSALSQRSCQVVRRRLRALEKEELIMTKMHGYGRDRGRPEDLISLTEKGASSLENEGIRLSYTANKLENPLSIDHLLIINWFRIHLLQMKRNIPQLSVKYLDPNSQPLAWDREDNPSIPEGVPANKKQEKLIEFIPDGIFSITVEKKTLLFFLEVDMDTETLASMNRSHKDIRQKILRYQTLFRSGKYKRYECVFNSTFNGFRLLFLVISPTRLISLCRLVREMPPSNFIWLVDQEKMFSHGLSAKIWARGGRDYDPPESILGTSLTCELPLMETTNHHSDKRVSRFPSE